MQPPVRAIVVRVGQPPVVETLFPDPSGDGHLKAMQSIVGGMVEHVGNFDGRGTDLWCNDEGMLLDLPLNRVIPAPARPDDIPEGFTVIKTDPELADPGEPGEWRIHGDFFICRATDDGELADATDEDVAYYKDLFAKIDAFRHFETALQALKLKPDVIAAQKCMPAPIGCGGEAREFRDELSATEYRITGLCQKCQDEFYDEYSDLVEKG